MCYGRVNGLESPACYDTELLRPTWTVWPNSGSLYSWIAVVRKVGVLRGHAPRPGSSGFRTRRNPGRARLRTGGGHGVEGGGASG